MDKTHALIAFVVLAVVTAGAMIGFKLVGSAEAQQTPFVAYMLVALGQLGYLIWGKVDSDKKVDDAADKAADKAARKVTAAIADREG